MQNLIITNAGKELMTGLVAESTTASFTKIVTSSHVYEKAELESLTKIEEVKQEIFISSIERKDASMIEIIAVTTNEELTEGYYINTIGVYVHDGEGNEILYAVAIDDTPDYLDAFDNKTISKISYKLDVKVSNSSQVTLELPSGAYATVEQLEELNTKISGIADLSGIEEMIWDGYVATDCKLSDDTNLVTSTGERIKITKTLF